MRPHATRRHRSEGGAVRHEFEAAGICAVAPPVRIDARQGSLGVPDPEDATIDSIDGEEENDDDEYMSWLEVAMFCLFTWREDRTPKALTFLQNYCSLLVMRKMRMAFGGSVSDVLDKVDEILDKADEALDELEAMSIDEGYEWIRRTYEDYMGDRDIAVIFHCS